MKLMILRLRIHLIDISEATGAANESREEHVGIPLPMLQKFSHGNFVYSFLACPH